MVPPLTVGVRSEVARIVRNGFGSDGGRVAPISEKR
jgi:hypothetical protein